MSEGRSELERAIDVWEQRHAAAVRAKREAEVVMPFLRAAVEELDTFRADGATTIPDTSSPVAAATAPTPAPSAPSPFDGNFGADGDEEPTADAPTEITSAFQPRGIAALMDTDEDEGEAAAG
jgi:hypothetical protein